MLISINFFIQKHWFLHFYSQIAFSERKLFLNTLELYLLERHVFRLKIVQFWTWLSYKKWVWKVASYNFFSVYSSHSVYRLPLSPHCPVYLVSYGTQSPMWPLTGHVYLIIWYILNWHWFCNQGMQTCMLVKYVWSIHQVIVSGITSFWVTVWLNWSVVFFCKSYFYKNLLSCFFVYHVSYFLTYAATVFANTE